MPQNKFQDLKIIEKRPAINFINTIDWRGRDPSTDYIHNYADLVDWASYAGLSQTRANELKKKAEEVPEKATKAYEEAIRFREVSYRILNKISDGQGIDPADKEILNDEMQSMFDHIELNLDTKKLELQDTLELNSLLRLMVKDLVELLTSDELDRVKRCNSDECGWIFIDTSKNNSRKWCRMRGCGNREKARRYYQRSQQ